MGVVKTAATEWYAPYVLAIGVSILNIMLNFAVRAAAIKGENYTGSLFSWTFVGAFLVGLCSILTLLGLYSSGLTVARALVLAGAGSIVLGSLISLAVENVELPLWRRLPTTEWLLLAMITSLFVFRFIASRPQ